MSQKLLKTITSLYREKNYTGHELSEAISSLYHSLVRDPKLASAFLDIYGVKISNPGFSTNKSKYNHFESEWSNNIHNKSFEELSAEERSVIIREIITDLKENLEKQYKKADIDLEKAKEKKTYSKDDISKINKHYARDRESIIALNEDVAKYIDSIKLDATQELKSKLLKSIKSKDNPVFWQEEEIFDNKRGFNEQEKENFKETILFYAKPSNQKERTKIEKLVNRYLEKRAIKVINNNENTELKSKTMTIKNKTLMKEAIFTIPKTQVVFYDPQTLKDIAREFTKKFYPDYNCAFAIHKDELRIEEMEKLRKKGKLNRDDYVNKISGDNRGKYNFSGDHLHIFFSGFDKNGDQNILLHDKRMASQFALDNNIKDKNGNVINFFKSDLDYEDLRIMGSIKQTMFRDFFNEHLEKEGLKIQKLAYRDEKYDLEKIQKQATQKGRTKEERLEEYDIDSYAAFLEIKEEERQLKEQVSITEQSLQKLHEKEAELDIELPFYEKQQKDLIDQRLETFEENERERITRELEQKLLNSNTELENNTAIIEALNKEIEEKQAQTKALNEVLNNKTVLENEFNLSKNKLKYAIQENIDYVFDPKEEHNFYSMNSKKEKQLLSKHRKNSFDFHSKFDFTPRDIYFEEDTLFGKKKKKRKETEEEIQKRYYAELNNSNVLEPLIERDKLHDQMLEAIKDIRDKEQKTFVNKQIENFNNVWNNLFNKSLTDTQKELDKERELREELETKIQQTQEKLKEEIENSNSWKKSYDSLEKSFLSYKTAIVTLFSNLSDKRYSILELAKIAFKGEWHNPINKDLRDIENSVNEAKAYPETPITIQLLDENGDEIKKPEIKRGLDIK